MRAGTTSALESFVLSCLKLVVVIYLSYFPYGVGLSLNVPGSHGISTSHVFAFLFFRDFIIYIFNEKH